MTSTVTHEIAGEVHIPSVFNENIAVILASLDFARVWEGHGNRVMVARELRQVSQYAQALARQAEHYADRAEQ